MINKIKKLRAKVRGFTLIETLIAIFVLMLAITGPLTIVQKGLQTTVIAKDQDTAFYLAQDAVEYVRFVRDTNKLQNSASDWLRALDGTAASWTAGSPTLDSGVGQNGDCVSAGGTQFCTIDSLKNIITSCGASGALCGAINYDSANNYFSYTTGSVSIFTRKISIQTPVSGNAGEAQLTVTVSYSDPQAHSVTVREDLFNWQ